MVCDWVGSAVSYFWPYIACECYFVQAARSRFGEIGMKSDMQNFEGNILEQHQEMAVCIDDLENMNLLYKKHGGKTFKHPSLLKFK